MIVAGLLTLAVLAVVRFDLLPALRGPAPYPPEWQWELRSGPTSGRYLPAALAAGGLLAALAWSGTAAAARRQRTAGRLLLGLAVLLGVGFQLGLLDLEPAGAADALFARAVSRTGSSYYTVATSSAAEDPVWFVAHHAELLEGFRKAAKHAATHPPGPVLFYRGFIALAEHSPRLTAAVLETAGVPDARPNPRRPRPQHTPASRAGAFLGALAIAALGAGTAWPIASLARHLGATPLAAARLGLLWCLLPGPALMTPQFDVALAFPVAAATAALAAAVLEDDGYRRAGWAAGAGVLGGIALFFSYGAAAFLLVGGLAALAAGADRPRPFDHAWPAALIATTAAALVVALPMAIGNSPLQAARIGLAIHREFYTQPRDYRLWLLFNPLDLAVFLGVPLAALWILRSVGSLHALLRGRHAREDAVRAATTVGLVALVLTGVTRGEVGRLWIPLMPLLLITTLGPREDGPSAPEALVIGALLACVTVTLRIFWQVP